MATKDTTGSKDAKSPILVVGRSMFKPTKEDANSKKLISQKKGADLKGQSGTKQKITNDGIKVADSNKEALKAYQKQAKKITSPLPKKLAQKAKPEHGEAFLKKLLTQPDFVDFHPLEASGNQWDYNDLLTEPKKDETAIADPSKSKVSFSDPKDKAFKQRLIHQEKDKPNALKLLGEKPEKDGSKIKPTAFSRDKDIRSQGYAKKSSIVSASTAEDRTYKQMTGHSKPEAAHTFTYLLQWLDTITEELANDYNNESSEKEKILANPEATHSTRKSEGLSNKKQDIIGKIKPLKSDHKKTKLLAKTSAHPQKKSAKLKKQAPASVPQRLSALIDSLWDYQSSNQQSSTQPPTARQDRSANSRSSRNSSRDDSVDTHSIQPIGLSTVTQDVGSISPSIPDPISAPSSPMTPQTMAEELNQILKEQAWLRGNHIP